MAETDWKEILSFSQRELVQADKDNLCESLSWMEADDIELNFTDLKTLFRLSQDILKYKSEQVNNLMGELEKLKRKGGKLKHKKSLVESPVKSPNSNLETITRQEELIKRNKNILQQLHSDIAELEDRKNKYQDKKVELEKDSDSSRDPLSEINATVQLENEIFEKNRHIRKLLADVKILEENNVELKEKISQLKEKLKEATQLIENLTEQLFSINSERNQFKEALGNCEQTKVHLLAEIQSLNKEVNAKDANKENVQIDIKTKLQHLKTLLKSHKNEIERLYTENTQLKEQLILDAKPAEYPKTEPKYEEEIKMKELQVKLLEASNEMEHSANLIQLLKRENKRLIDMINEGAENPDISMPENKNESDDGKEKNLIMKLRKKINILTVNLQASEEMTFMREKELAEIATQLQLVQSDEGIKTLLKGLKNKKRQLKLKDEGIKNLVIEINNLTQYIDELELENETLRQKLKIPSGHNVLVNGTLKKYQEIEKTLLQTTKILHDNENKIVDIELNNRHKSSEISMLKKMLNELGYDNKKINEIFLKNIDEEINKAGTETLPETKEVAIRSGNVISKSQDPEIQAIIDENEGLRTGLKEILDFLKDNSTSSSGILALKCPSLETICHSMDARRMAGWFGSHMTAQMDLKAALGGKDALLTALHESRKETFEIMTQLSKESQKSSKLEQKLLEMESQGKTEDIPIINSFPDNFNMNDLFLWVDDDEANKFDIANKSQVQTTITKVNHHYYNQFKNCLHYFHCKFKVLHDDLTSLAITATDNHNKWSIQEENYKVEIENLKSQLLQNANDQTSIHSPGSLRSPEVIKLQRKIGYLEELYKHVRTQYENLKNEYLQSKRETMLNISENETNIQKLLLFNIDLADKFRRCVPAALFWEQNVVLNEYITKYRNISEVLFNIDIEKNDFLKRLQEDKLYILKYFQTDDACNQAGGKGIIRDEKFEEKLEKSVHDRQLQQLNSELNKKNLQIKDLNAKNMELQIKLARVIDDLMGPKTDKAKCSLEQEVYKLREENNIVKQENKRIESQLNTSLCKLNESQQQKDNTDIEINLLRHQILDLQSAGDNKAIIARLSGEILICHLQISENNSTIERLTQAINKEKHLRAEAEDMFNTVQKILNDYILSYEIKFREMFHILQMFRQEYQGSLPLCTIESYLSNVEEMNRQTFDASEKLNEIEELRSRLMVKHSVYSQILETARVQCNENANRMCEHNFRNGVTYELQKQELDLCNKKIQALEQSRRQIIDRCNSLEKTLVRISQGYNYLTADEKKCINNSPNNVCTSKQISSSSTELEELPSEDEASSAGNLTFTLPASKFVKPPQMALKCEENEPHFIGTSKAYSDKDVTCKVEVVNVHTQTFILNEIEKTTKLVQTDEDYRIKELQFRLVNLEVDNKKKTEELSKHIKDIQHLTEKISLVNEQKYLLESTTQSLTISHNEKDESIKSLQYNIRTLKNELEEFKSNQYMQLLRENGLKNDEYRNLLESFKKLENEKASMLKEYKDLLTKEREEYSKTVTNLQEKLRVFESKLNGRGANSEIGNGDILQEAVSKYILKISELDDKCFKLQSDLNVCETEIITCQSELIRWKDLATERLSKMEQLGAQLKERHNVELESYKAENHHWLSQLNDTQREHMELRSRLTEQKTHYIKQLADKEAHIEHLRSVVQSLRTQIMNMQTMISINDPSFDLSAIVEVEEGSDAVSPQVSERLELKFESVVDLHDLQDDYIKMPTSSTVIWQEPLIERLRREKQLISKQNAILRRQIKAIAARERRARLDAQNLKNQVFRISTSGSKVATAESAALHNKIASLQAQLTSARRDAHSTVAIWDKWKRAQQTADKWQVRFEEKCQVERKLETSLNLTKSALSRLEKEKKALLARISELKNDRSSAIEKQDEERSEKGSRSQREYQECSPTPPVSTRALLDRIQAQQRRLAALEIAEKGNEPLVAEYEKALAEITSLKGQVLKLESTLLESQIRTPLDPSSDSKPELDYWKSYCDMLKDENMQLTLRVNSLETTPTSAHQQRINDLEQTVLTLRGLVSKLQAEQKSGTSVKRADSRPSSGRSMSDKVRNQLDSYRMEISNLKRTIQEKDLLLEKSKEMLKIAAEREEHLLRENMLLRRRFDELVERNGGSLSA